MVYCYGVCEASGAVGGDGLQDQPLRTVAAAGLTAVVSDVDGARPAASEEALWRHEQVVEGLMAGGAVLPMRFGSVLDDDRAVAALLRERAAEFRQALERVAGAIELGVRAAWESGASAPQPARAHSGAGYLQGLLDHRSRASDLAERIDAPLSAMSRDSRRRLLVTPRLPLSGAYLVDHDRLEAFRQQVAVLDEEIDQAEIVCTGPWPPYSFVGPGERERR